MYIVITSSSQLQVEIQQLRQELQESKQCLQQERQEKQQLLKSEERLQQENDQLRQVINELRQEKLRFQQECQEVRQENQQIQEREQQEKQILRQQLNETITRLQQDKSGLEDRVQELEHDSSWIVRREEIILSSEILGTGGWGEVKVATFRGLRVAAKCLYEVILSEYNVAVFTREMSIAANVRHPNLLQFIGATPGDLDAIQAILHSGSNMRDLRLYTPIILCELMPTSLSKELQKSPLTRPQIIRISQDVTSALNYLHLWKPHPILHRDVSSPNVLLEPSGSGQWKGKLSDYGSANLAQNISSTSVGPGNPFYSAPEAQFPDNHSPAMDVYSFGVLLMEMILRRSPSPTSAERERQAESIQWPSLKPIVKQCLNRQPTDRPTIAQVLSDLKI